MRVRNSVKDSPVNILASLIYHKPLALLLPLSALAFLPVLLGGFVWDDHFLLTSISAYFEPDIKAILSTPVNGFEYLPVRDISLLVDAQLWGQRAFGFHLSNLVYYLLVITLVQCVLLRLGNRLNQPHARRLAFWTTLLFALHPLHTEAVAFIAARNNLLAMLFVLWSLHAFLDVLDGRRRAMLWCLLAFVLALLSKASVLYFPFALVGLYTVMTPRENQQRQHWLLLSLLLFVDLAATALHFGIARELGTLQPEIGRFGVLDPLQAMWRAALIPVFYLRYFLLPWPLNVAYDEIALLQWAQPLVALPLYLLYIGMLALAWRWRHRSRWPLLGLGWFFLTLLPVASLLPTIPVVADRYVFPGMLGLAMLAAPWSLRWHWAAWALALLLLGLSFNRSLDWSSDVTLWESAWQVTPETAAPAYFHALYQAGRLDKALLLAGLENPPSYRLPLYRGIQHLEQNQPERAIAELQRAEILSAGYTEIIRGRTQQLLGQAYEKAGQPIAALDAWLKLFKPDSIWVKYFFGVTANQAVLRLRSRLEGQRRELTQAAETRPKDVRAQGDLGLFLLQTGEYEKAIVALRAALHLLPGNHYIRYNLALATLHADRPEQAQKLFAQITSGFPLYAESQNHLAVLYVKQKAFRRAQQHFRQALAHNPRLLNARYNLARLYFRQGNRKRARKVLVDGFREASVGQKQQLNQLLRAMRLRPDKD